MHAKISCFTVCYRVSLTYKFISCVVTTKISSSEILRNKTIKTLTNKSSVQLRLTNPGVQTAVVYRAWLVNAIDLRTHRCFQNIHTFDCVKRLTSIKISTAQILKAGLVKQQKWLFVYASHKDSTCSSNKSSAVIEICHSYTNRDIASALSIICRNFSSGFPAVDSWRTFSSCGVCASTLE